MDFQAIAMAIIILVLVIPIIIKAVLVAIVKNTNQSTTMKKTTIPITLHGKREKTLRHPNTNTGSIMNTKMATIHMLMLSPHQIKHHHHHHHRAILILPI